MNAQQRGWGRGWPNCHSSKILTVRCGRLGLRLPVRSEIAALVAGLVDALEADRGKPFRPDWSWGFACRAIRNSNRPSNHSWGLAIDLDAPENPQLKASDHRKAHQLRKTFPGGVVLRSSMPDKTQAIAEKHGFVWGGNYRDKPDPMHFEFRGTPGDAKRLSSGGASDAPCARTYTVKAGDTLSEIGQRLGVDWRKIAAANKIREPFIIRPGQVLCF